ncbi:MAG: ISAs1-like element ISEc26 family transposase [Burkholderiaceae bacterium]
MNPGVILIQRLKDLDDPRVTGRCDHALVDILVIALCAVMAGAEGWDDIEGWGEANVERLRQYLELRNGIPGHDTIRRVFEAIDPKRLETVLLEWIGHVCPALGGVIAIDGKSVRGSGSTCRGQRALHVVSAYASEMGLVLGQQRCEEKSNEITAIEALLPNLGLTGCIVTIDAMGCQTAIAAQVIERQGDYLLNVKDNQPKLAQAIEEYFRIGEQHAWVNLKSSHFETLDKGHGRLETRRCVALAVPDYLPELTRWSGIKSIARIEAIREAHGKKTTEIRYLIGSVQPDAQAILSATRLHWGIENGLHRCLDVAFREDASAVHLRQAAANLGVVRKLALNLFRLDTTSKLSLPRKRKHAAWKPDYLFDLLGIQPMTKF